MASASAAAINQLPWAKLQERQNAFSKRTELADFMASINNVVSNPDSRESSLLITLLSTASCEQIAALKRNDEILVKVEELLGIKRCLLSVNGCSGIFECDSHCDCPNSGSDYSCCGCCCGMKPYNLHNISQGDPQKYMYKVCSLYNCRVLCRTGYKFCCNEHLNLSLLNYYQCASPKCCTRIRYGRVCRSCYEGSTSSNSESNFWDPVPKSCSCGCR